VSSVSAEDHVRLVEMRANSDSNRFLTHIGMASAMDQSSLMRFRKSFLTKPDQKHPLVKLNQGHLPIVP